jgi:hypothetical protein
MLLVVLYVHFYNTVVVTSDCKFGYSGQCYDFKNIFAKKLDKEKIYVAFGSNYGYLARKKLIVTCFLRKQKMVILNL